MKIVGLTGGIASGKSTIAKMFREVGASVIDADQVSRDVTAPGSEGIAKLQEVFGDGIIDAQGGLDRQAMRAIVFDDREKLRLLESITHPLIYTEIGNWVRDCVERGDKAAIIEATLIIEAPPPQPLDALIVVVCDEKTRLERTQRRDGFDPDHIRKVMEAQLSDQERIRHADYVIRNEGTLEEVFAEVKAVWVKITAANEKLPR